MLVWFFSHLGFWSGNLFLIAPFPDLCLLVPLYNENNNSKPGVGYRVPDSSTTDRDFSSTEGNRSDRQAETEESDSRRMRHRGTEIGDLMDTEEYKIPQTPMEGNH